MQLLDLVQYVLNAEIHVCGEANALLAGEVVENYGSCPATALTSVAAAFATQGYWVQADLLDMLTVTSLSALGPLLYIIAVIGGLIGVAIGQPPRIYMWFFLGPALYGWLIDTRQDVTGVQWQVAQMQQDQREVWKLAEVGLINTNMARRLDEWGGGHNITSQENPSDVSVANFFVWYDSVLSSVINGLVEWAGPYSQLNNPTTTSTNINGGVDWDISDEAVRNDRWFLLSNLKWSLLQDITNVKLTNAALRDSFATFIGGLCGDTLSRLVDETAFAAAAHGRGDLIPETIFVRPDIMGPPSPGPNTMDKVVSGLKIPLVEYPSNLKQLFVNRVSQGNFAYASNVEGGMGNPGWGAASYLTGDDPDYDPAEIYCDQYLLILLLAFRWEAAQVYNQIVLKAPVTSLDGVGDQIEERERRLLYNLFYGWNLKTDFSPLVGSELEEKDVYSGNALDFEQTRNFMINLILLHLVRNEFAIVKQPIDVRRIGSELATSYSEGQMRTVGSISRFGEIYSWAILMPYLQGVLLYFLAIAYPFACLLMIIPGMHKSLFTWMSFWAWVKIWDVGFALVMALERSIWAMVGNSAKSALLYEKVANLSEWGSIGFDSAQICDANGCLMRGFQLLSGPTGSPIQFNTNDLVNHLYIFDRALAMGPTLDLDLANSYYIYIMAALYLAVPAVTGQLVLGARAGAASLVTQAIGSNAQDAGKASGAGYSADLSQRAKSSSHSIGQAAYAAHLQKSNLATQALEIGNKQAIAQWRGSEAGAWQQAMDVQSQAKQLHSQQYGSIANFGKSQASAAATGLSYLSSPVSKSMGGGSSIPAYGLGPQLLGAGYDRASGIKSIDALQAAKEANVAKGQLGVAGFQAQSYAGAYGRAGQLKQSEAQFGADTARWNAQNQMANQLGSSLAAQGVSPLVLDPGQKPMNADGMALNGMLGSEAESKGRYFDPFSGSPLYGMIDQAASSLGQAVPSQVEAKPTGQQLTNDATAEMIGILSHMGAKGHQLLATPAGQEFSQYIQGVTGGKPVDPNDPTKGLQGGFDLQTQLPEQPWSQATVEAKKADWNQNGGPIPDLSRYDPGSSSSSEIHTPITQSMGKGKGGY